MLEFISTQVKETLSKAKSPGPIVSKNVSITLPLTKPDMPEIPNVPEIHDQTQGHTNAIMQEERLLREKDLLRRVSKLHMEPTDVLLTTDWVISLDSGGHPQFHRLLPTFITDLDVALYVLKLNEKLDDYPKVEWYNDGNLRGEAYSYHYTNEWMLKRTIQGLASMYKPPSIIFVGTHRDLEHDSDEKIADKNAKLKSTLFPEFKKHVLLHNDSAKDVIFPINSLNPGREDEEVVDKLKRVIMSHRNTNPIRLKLTHLFLGLEIKALAERKGHSIVSKVDCCKIGSSLGLSQDEVNDAILFLSKCKLLYYNEFIPDVVFCDLQSILSTITRFVKNAYELQEPVWDLIIRGQFSEDMIENDEMKILFIDGLFCKNQYTDLLEHLGVISVINENPHKTYFMPLLLKELSPSQLKSVNSSCIGLAQPIILFYDKGWPTNGTFCTLIARLLSRKDEWKITEKDSIPIQLFSNCIQLSFFNRDIQGACLVNILDCFQYIELNVYISGMSNASDEECGKVYRSTCPKILRTIEHILNESHANGKVHTTFMCPCGKPAILRLENRTLQCSRDDTITFPLSHRDEVWQLPSHTEK